MNSLKILSISALRRTIGRIRFVVMELFFGYDNRLCLVLTFIYRAVWRISNADIESLAQTKHPFGFEKCGRCVLVVRVPVRELSSR